ncbi:hypothetical protein LJ656_05395 [Paraburkholderia sp. MMS20-SJTR3]|uniref:Uncharacterized protein n=1 Tax=Paraburkholderia sejongensis TaxID=2886946 RepID=A0ABS8JQ75_9BURK|nr:hypothetical protein [Paraburkholderia sp. MMS20-SJTR3]MCC8392017.1 hypothetical protein [Paraburkholderia sp. MMS20-SJTR3]
MAAWDGTSYIDRLTEARRSRVPRCGKCFGFFLILSFIVLRFIACEYGSGNRQRMLRASARRVPFYG